MILFDKINEDLKNAMKNKDQVALRGIRAIKSALLMLKTESNEKEISSDEEVKLLQRLVKQRKESMEIYKNQNRPDLAKEEDEELKVISAYLPQQMSVDEITEMIKEIIVETKATSISDLGRIIPIAMKKAAGKADGKTISAIVKEQLASQ